jgi:hypothetical protein
MKALFIFIALSIFTMQSYAKVYKCKIDGEMVYQQTQCDSEAGQSLFKIRKDTSSDYNDFERKLISQNKVAIGMSEKALLRSWGKPNKINRSGLGSDQWIYYRGNIERQYVYVDKGFVTNWSD